MPSLKLNNTAQWALEKRLDKVIAHESGKYQEWKLF